jgi:hypothetical protein
MLVASNNKQNQVSLVHTHMLLGMQKLPQKKKYTTMPHMLAQKNSVYVHHYGLCVHVPNSLLKASVVVPSFKGKRILIN